VAQRDPVRELHRLTLAVRRRACAHALGGARRRAGAVAVVGARGEVRREDVDRTLRVVDACVQHVPLESRASVQQEQCAVEHRVAREDHLFVDEPVRKEDLSVLAAAGTRIARVDRIEVRVCEGRDLLQRDDVRAARVDPLKEQVDPIRDAAEGALRSSRRGARSG
jgi:hypothetical protein